MATESERKCPICHDDEEDDAYLSPCFHHFCLGCAVRWAQQRPNCAMCRSVATDIVFSVWSDDDYLTFEIPRPAELSDEDFQDTVSRAQEDAFPPEVWMDFFRSHPDSVRPLMPWLRRQLRMVYEDQWWNVAAVEGTIVAHLCLCGLDEAVLERQLQNCLPELTGTFIHHLIMAATHLCGRALRQHLAQQDPQAAEEEEEEKEDNPGSSPNPTTSREGTPGPQQAFPSGFVGPQPLEDLGEAAAAGSLAQGGGCRPSAPVRGRECSHTGPRRPRKRKAPEPQESPQPCKRPPRRRRRH